MHFVKLVSKNKIIKSYLSGPFNVHSPIGKKLRSSKISFQKKIKSYLSGPINVHSLFRKRCIVG